MGFKEIMRKCVATKMELQLQHLLFVLFLLALYPDSTLQCNCVAGKCLANGSCEAGVACKDNYFGVFCEYIDILDQSSLQPSQLNDDDLTTCLAMSGDLDLSYNSSKVYMVRVIVSHTSLSPNITFTFKNHSSVKSCDGHVHIVDTATFEYYCDKMIDSQELTIGGVDGNDVCHVYITEGRNMMEGASITTKWPVSDVSLYNKEGLIDGNNDYAQGSCFQTLRIRGPKNSDTINFALKAVSFINYAEVFGNAALGNESMIVGATVMFIDINRRFRFIFETDQLRTKKYNAEPLAPLRQARILKEKIFGACEITAVGDCINGTWGINCTNVCKPRCRNSKCTSQGFCVSCMPGLVAPRCCKEFCALDKDCGDTGLCINGCQDRKYGLECDKNCSRHCAGDGSCDINGKCTHGCNIGYFGHDCSLACSPNCGGQGDCNINGSCISACKPGYFGHDCTKYPLGCNCVDFQCDSNFTCEAPSECKSKTFGYYCEYVEVDIENANDTDLGDDDKSTCNAVTGDLVVSYNDTRIYMIRLIVEDSSLYKNIKFAFQGIPLQPPDHEEECNGQLLLVETTIVEYYCKRFIISQRVVIKGMGGKKICHVHLTEGRNVVQGSQAWSTSNSTDHRYYEVEGLVNGVKENIKGSCFLTEPFTQTKTIAIYLNFPALLNLAYIHGLTTYDMTYRMDASFKIQDNKNVDLQRFVLREPSAKVYYQHTDSAVHHLTGTITHPFGACEIELLGDCGFGKYGFHCNLTCSRRCKDSRCTTQGDCIGCREGFSGKRCCKEFCDPDKPCGEDGMCINGCVLGKAGLDCTRDCSPYCGGDGSCENNGNCKHGCQPGYYGEQCLHLAMSSHMLRRETMTCHCSGNKCKHPRDQCEDFTNCIHGWFGYDCAYRDLAINGNASHPSLNDNDIDTCQPGDENHAHANWAAPIMFSSIVLTFKDDSDVGKFVVITSTQNFEDRFKEDLIRYKTIKNHVYQVDILTRMEIDKVTVTWSGSGSLCSFNVAGDRDLALEMGPVLEKNPDLAGTINPLTDGRINGDNCINTKQITTLQFPFESSVYISRVVFYPDIFNHEEASYDISYNHVGVPQLTETHFIEGNDLYIAPVQFNKQYDAVQMDLTNERNGTVKICEIQIFGECYPPFYGYACKERCPPECPDEECDYRGDCLKGTFIAALQAKSSAGIVQPITLTAILILISLRMF